MLFGLEWTNQVLFLRSRWIRSHWIRSKCDGITNCFKMSISSLWSKDLYLPPVTEVWGKGNIFTSVCHSFCPRGGGSASRWVCMGGSASTRGLHPWGGVCIQGVGPLHQILQDTVNEQVVRILLEWILVCFDVLSKNAMSVQIDFPKLAKLFGFYNRVFT